MGSVVVGVEVVVVTWRRECGWCWWRCGGCRGRCRRGRGGGCLARVLDRGLHRLALNPQGQGQRRLMAHRVVEVEQRVRHPGRSARTAVMPSEKSRMPASLLRSGRFGNEIWILGTPAGQLAVAVIDAAWASADGPPTAIDRASATTASAKNSTTRKIARTFDMFLLKPPCTEYEQLPRNH